MIRKIIFLVLLISISIYSQACAESFDIFIEKFFKDPSFQKERIKYPFYKTDCRIDIEKDNTTCKDTLMSKNSRKWVHLKYDNGMEYVSHKLFTDEKGQNRNVTPKSNLIVMELNAEGTDFNLIYVFKRKNDSWFLIKVKQWEIY